MTSLGNRIAEGIANGESVLSIDSNIQQYLGDAYRADLVANTEVARAQNEGQSQELQGMGFTRWTWMAYDGACEECMGKNDIEFTWNDETPPAHPNCRCSITGTGDIVDTGEGA